jgi:hypothetical protein
MEPAEAMDSATVAEELAARQRDRRAVPRYGVDEDASLLLVEHGSTIACRLANLGLNGCRVRTMERIRVGAGVHVELSFRVRGLAFRFSGVTQWTDGRQLAGIRFVNVISRRRDDLVEALSEVKEENARRAEELAAEQLAAAKLEAEAKAAAPETAETQAVEQAGQDNKRVEQAEQPAPELETAISGARGRADDLGSASQRLPEQRLAAVLSPGRPQPPALREAEAHPAASSPHRSVGRERREQAREEVDTSAVIYLINVGSKLSGRILDLSLRGCRIRADERFPVGIYTRVETEFRIEGLPFRLGGVIQSIHDRHNVGIRFLDVSDRKREQVEQLIEEIRELKERGIGIRP